MAREFAKSFYNSSAWRMCRRRYIELMPRYKRGLCELCYEKGIHKLGEEVHHKVELTPANINDIKITLNHDNLILLCHDCHTQIHMAKYQPRLIYDEDGNVYPNPNYIPL